MCGAYSAFGLDEAERLLWPHLRERLRQPGRSMGVMRGVLGGLRIVDEPPEVVVEVRHLVDLGLGRPNTFSTECREHLL